MFFLHLNLNMSKISYSPLFVFDDILCARVRYLCRLILEYHKTSAIQLISILY